jgi:hypothetical protein
MDFKSLQRKAKQLVDLSRQQSGKDSPGDRRERRQHLVILG